MAKLKSNPVNILVAKPSATLPPNFNPPYQLPGPGQAVAIGTNTAVTASSEYSPDFWYETLFNSFGAGIFHSDFSLAGAYIIACTGGHAHGDQTGAVLFDFADATWKYRKAKNPNSGSLGRPFEESDTNGHPYYEILNSEGCPAPPHPYAHLCPVPKSWVGNSKGGVIYITRAAVAREARTTGACHWFNLDTDIWSRRTNDVFPGVGSGFAGVEGEGLIDIKRKRYYVLSNEAHYASRLYYLDAMDWKIKQTPSFEWPPSTVASGRMFIHKDDFLIRHIPKPEGNYLFAIDLNNVAAGWTQLKISGILAIRAGDSNGERWAHWRGKYYHITRDGGNTLSRLTPPANPLTGTWVADKVVLNMSLPARSGTQTHHTSFFEVPAIDCLAWIPGNTNKVYVVRPE